MQHQAAARQPGPDGVCEYRAAPARRAGDSGSASPPSQQGNDLVGLIREGMNMLSSWRRERAQATAVA